MTLEEIVARVVVDVPGAPFMSVREQVRQAAREFCTLADAWVSDETPVVVAANTDYAEVSAPEGEALRLVSLTLDGRECVQGSDYVQLSATRIRFPERLATSVVYGRLALRPKHGEMPDQAVTDRWAEAFADGAIATLLKMPEPWRDLELALYHRRRFDEAVSHAKQVSRLGHGRGGGRVKARHFL